MTRGAHLAFFARRPPNKRQPLRLTGGVVLSSTEFRSPDEWRRKCPTCGVWVLMDRPRYHEHPAAYEVQPDPDGETDPAPGDEPRWVCGTDGCVLRLEEWPEPGDCPACGRERRLLERTG